jgi:ParB family chromosome partitioning protein
MNVLSIPIKQVTVSILNVRKQITCNEDEEGSIIDLANNIKINGLLNPLTVRFVNDEYEVIAGQRRYMAIKLLEWDTVPCNVMNVDNQKAKELSLVENIQRNQMTTADKVRAYSRLYEVYNKDINKVISVIHISKKTVEKYIKINKLPDDVIELLDKSGKEKISLDVAVELCKLNTDKVNIKDLCNKMINITTEQKIFSIRYIIETNYQQSITKIIEDVVISANSIKLEPSVPYVIDKKNNNNYIIIPENLYESIIDLINNK